MRVAPFFTAAALVLLTGGSAFATANFPAATRTHLSLTYDPQCALCHTNGITGKGTVTTPFGKSMMARGLVASDETALNSALDKMVTDKVDSDGDGVTDIDELKAGTDPNTKAGETATAAGYGCNATAGDPSALGAGLLVGLGLLVSRRRRAR